MKTVWGLLGTLCLTTAAHAVPVVVKVTGPDDLPVANAEVRVALLSIGEKLSTRYAAREPLRKAARTDEKGVANFDWPEPKNQPGLGQDTLGYVGTATVWTPRFGATNLTLKAGDNRVQLVKPAGIARGIVRDAKGAPVAGARVSALGLANAPGTMASIGRQDFAIAPGEAAFTVLSDGEGRWQIGNLPLGARANVQLIDPALAPDKATAPILGVATPPLEAVPNSAPDALNGNGILRAVPAASLDGRVLDDKGEAVAGATVWATIEQSPDDYLPPTITTTDAQGAYQLQGLAPGTYEVLVRAPQTSPLVADPKILQKIAVKSGQNQTLPVQKLIPGGVLEVQVNDANDGKPIPNARVSVSRKDSPRAEWTFPLGSATGPDGKLKLHLAPAQYTVHISSEGYIAPRITLTRDGGDEPITIVTGETQSVNQKLERGLSAGGRVVDEAGTALPDVALYLSAARDGDDMFNNIGVESDATGEWQANTFLEAQYQIQAGLGSYDQKPDWEVVSPQNFAVPARGPITIVLRPVAKTTLSGRVVDSAGNGVVNAHIVAKIDNGSQEFGENIEREAFSDAQGNYTLPAFPTTAQNIALSVERAGYISSKLPQAQNDANQWSSSDAVLQALSSHVGGRIFNANNEAQQGVQVLAPRFDGVAVSDENGAWQIDNIAPGETEIVVVGTMGAVVENVTTGRDDVTLKLRPYAAAPPSDINEAKAILDEAWQTSRGSTFSERASLPVTLAPYAPDAALAMARSGEDKADENVIMQIVRAVAAQDAERAREWAPQVLAQLKTPENRLYTGLYLAQALVAAHPDEAKSWLEKSSALFGELKPTWQKRDVASKIAVLSAQLKLPAAQQRFEQALELAGPQKDAGYNFYSWLAWRVSRVNAEWAKQTVAAAIKDAPNQSEGPESTISYAIRRLAMWNLDAAQKMLEEHGDLKGSYGLNYEMDEARSTLLIQRLKRDEDVHAALKSARELERSTQYVLKRISDLAPTERRAEILHEALKLRRDQNYSSRSGIIDNARELLPYDRDGAKSILDEIAESFQTYDTHRDGFFRSRDIAAWASAYQSIDAAQARWQLEREWARQTNRIQLTPDEQKLRSRQMHSLILAMAALDVARAKQMIFALPVDQEGGAPFVAARTLSRWLLASEEERQSRSSGRWSALDMDDDFSEDR